MPIDKKEEIWYYIGVPEFIRICPSTIKQKIPEEVSKCFDVSEDSV